MLTLCPFKVFLKCTFCRCALKMSNKLEDFIMNINKEKLFHPKGVLFTAVKLWSKNEVKKS